MTDTTKPNDGGPAFPQSIASLLRLRRQHEEDSLELARKVQVIDREIAYRQRVASGTDADAMIAERERKP